MKRTTKQQLKKLSDLNTSPNINKVFSIRQKENRRNRLSYIFNIFCQKTAAIVGNAWSFIGAVFLVVIWGLSGYLFNFSDTWLSVIFASTTIITFLLIFLVQNTQNRDSEILHLKINELILAIKGARNNILKLDELSDEELKDLEDEYKK